MPNGLNRGPGSCGLISWAYLKGEGIDGELGVCLEALYGDAVDLKASRGEVLSSEKDEQRPQKQHMAHPFHYPASLLLPEMERAGRRNRKESLRCKQ